MSTTSSTNPPASSHFFPPISKSTSVPDIHKNDTDLGSGVNQASNNRTDQAAKRDKKDMNNLLITNSDSTESAIASPAGSLEQFEVSGFNNSTLPLTPEDATDSINGYFLEINIYEIKGIVKNLDIFYNKLNILP